MDSRGRTIDIGARVVHLDINWLVDSLSWEPTGSSVPPFYSTRVVLIEITDRPLYSRRAVVDAPGPEQPQITIVDAGDVLREVCHGHVRRRLP